MKLPLALAEKLLLLANGEKIAASKMKHPIISDLISEGIIHRPRKIKNIQRFFGKQLYSNTRYIKQQTSYHSSCRRNV